MRCLSLFSGAGGLDLGLYRAGFEIASSCDIDEIAIATLRKNFNHAVHCADVTSIPTSDFGAFKNIDLLVGGPPCQPFSASARWADKGTQGLDDRRSNTLRAFLDLVRALRPKVFLLENVPGFKSHGGLDFLACRIDEFRKSGLSYKWEWAILDGSTFGVPQKRKRLFAIGSRIGQPHLPKPEAGTQIGKLRTAHDAIHGLSQTYDEDLRIKGKWGDLIPSIPPGKNYQWHTARGGGVPMFGWRTRFWSFLQKLDPNVPAPTICANPAQNSGPFHWENRLLSTDELAALQSFPQDFRFEGSRRERQQQVGNAVPPLMAELIGREIQLLFGNAVPVVPSLELAKSSVQVPQIKHAIVSPKYRHLIGHYAPHPGSGQGPKPRTARQQVEV